MRDGVDKNCQSHGRKIRSLQGFGKAHTDCHVRLGVDTPSLSSAISTSTSLIFSGMTRNTCLSFRLGCNLGLATGVVHIGEIGRRSMRQWRYHDDSKVPGLGMEEVRGWTGKMFYHLEVVLWRIVEL